MLHKKITYIVVTRNLSALIILVFFGFSLCTDNGIAPPNPMNPHIGSWRRRATQNREILKIHDSIIKDTSSNTIINDTNNLRFVTNDSIFWYAMSPDFPTHFFFKRQSYSFLSGDTISKWDTSYPGLEYRQWQRIMLFNDELYEVSETQQRTDSTFIYSNNANVFTRFAGVVPPTSWPKDSTPIPVFTK